MGRPLTSGMNPSCLSYDAPARYLRESKHETHTYGDVCEDAVVVPASGITSVSLKCYELGHRVEAELRRDHLCTPCTPLDIKAQKCELNFHRCALVTFPELFWEPLVYTPGILDGSFPATANIIHEEQFRDFDGNVHVHVLKTSIKHVLRLMFRFCQIC